MVNLRLSIKNLFFSLLFLSLFILLMSGCGPVTQVKVAPDFKPAPEKEIVYILPFAATLVPKEIAGTVFDTFVDNLNDKNKQADIRWFSIIKEEPAQFPKEWLGKQVYLSGEIWSYIENSGCCSTELRIKARLFLHEPGKNTPTLEVFVPQETFFDHDSSTLEAERQKFAEKLANELSSQVLKALEQRR